MVDPYTKGNNSIFRYLIALLAIYLIYLGYDNYFSLKSELIAEQSAHSYLILYAPENCQAKKPFSMLAAMYGFRVLVKPPIADTVQIELANGTRMELMDFVTALRKIDVVNFHPGANPGTVYLYGVANCPYAAKARQMLIAKEIPFVDVNLNNRDDPAMLGFEERVIASGFAPDEPSRNPYLEYHGKIYQNPDLYKVIEEIK